MKTKLCSKCNTEKPVEEFPKNKCQKDGLGSWCSICHSIYMKNYKVNPPKKFTPNTKNGRICSKCKIEKPLDAFAKNPTNKSGYSNWCKECVNLQRRNKYKKEKKCEVKKPKMTNDNKMKIVNNEIYTNLLMKKFEESEKKFKSTEDALLQFEMSDREIIIDELSGDEKDKKMLDAEKRREIKIGLEFLKYNKFTPSQKKEIINILDVDLMEILKDKMEAKIQEQEKELRKSKDLMKILDIN